MAKTKYFYHPLYATKLIEFFSPPHYTIKDITITKADGTQIDKSEMEALPPIFLSDFAKSIGIKRGYSQLFSRWKDKFPKFAEALKEAKELEVERIRVNGSLGLYNAAFSIFTLKNIAGWRDRQELEHTGKVDLKDHIIIIRSISDDKIASSNRIAQEVNDVAAE